MVKTVVSSVAYSLDEMIEVLRYYPDALKAN